MCPKGGDEDLICSLLHLSMYRGSNVMADDCAPMLPKVLKKGRDSQQ